MSKNKKLLIVIVINLLIFFTVNILFNVKYEQVDDFIIYNLYSGLDGTYNIHGIYIHPVICFILSIFFRIIPMINWHTIFLLISQFICFTIIGYTLLKRQYNNKMIILYTSFVSVCYPTLLMLIQYTSISALLIITSFILLIDLLENKEFKNIKSKILIFLLFTLGIMTRMQSIIIIIPYFGIYFIYNIIKVIKKEIEKKDIFELIKCYFIYLLITVIVYTTSLIIYNSDKVYKNYMEYNDIRTQLNDIIYVDYEENKEIFDEIGWSKNDHYMFYTFGFGDENIYSKDNLEKILNYKIEKDGKYNLNYNISEIFNGLINEQTNTYTYISILFITLFILNLFYKNKNKFSIIVFLVTIGLHIGFIVIGRAMQRVIIPEYIIRNIVTNV